jgi:hypothetical protein
MLTALACLTACHRQPNRVAPAMGGEPNLMLWAWETPEDLTSLDLSKAGVAFLAREVLVNQQVTVRPRRQPLRIPSGTWLMAVVRIETGPNFSTSPNTEQQIADAVLEAAHEPGVRALQVDFDATASQRDLYARVLRRVAVGLPPHMPLSITALVSWCGPHSWLRSLPSGSVPIEEAVPMLFRMGGPAATRASAPRDQSHITESLCTGSIGVATDEAWPAIAPNQRVYVFRVGAWTPGDLARINRFGYQQLQGLPKDPPR